MPMSGVAIDCAKGVFVTNVTWPFSSEVVTH